MPSNISKSRLRKAFNEGRRSATSETADNPYDNLKLRKLWEQGRTQQRAGELSTPIPPLEHGETRAQRAPHNPPGSKVAARPAPRGRPRSGPPRSRNSPGFGGQGFGGRAPRGR